MTPWALLCSVVQSEMGLQAGQAYVYEQRFKLPPDSALYVAVGILDRKCIANTNRRVSVEDAGLNEVQFSTWWALLSIDLISKSTDARDRAEEVIMALKSTLMQQQCERYAYRFGELPKSFNNISSLDGSAIPYRFTASVAVQYSISKSKGIDYYDVFNAPTVDIKP